MSLCVRALYTPVDMWQLEDKLRCPTLPSTFLETILLLFLICFEFFCFFCFFVLLATVD